MSVTADLPDLNLWLALARPLIRMRTRFMVRSVSPGCDTAGIARSAQPSGGLARGVWCPWRGGCQELA